MGHASGIAQIIDSVKTPLALAALALLLGAPLLREIIKKGAPNKDTNAIIRYVFILGLSLGVLAIGSVIFSALVTREIRISGTVVNETGLGIGGAAVRIPGRAST